MRTLASYSIALPDKTLSNKIERDFSENFIIPPTEKL